MQFKALQALWVGSLMLMGVGCSTVPDRYVPALVGSSGTHMGSKEMAVDIAMDRDFQPLGNPITFTVTLRNISSHAYWIPRKPNLLFYWIYPTGQRDNYVMEFPPEHHYTEDEVFLLKPGQSYSVNEHIQTYYFPKPGITEFKVMVYSAANTNREWTPFWQGRIFSNSYGVWLVDKTDPRAASSLLGS